MRDPASAEPEATRAGRGVPGQAMPGRGMPGQGGAPVPTGTSPGGARFRPDHSHLSLAELRTYRNGLRNEENQVSYLRRVVQARIDLIESGDSDREGLSRYGEVFARARSGPGSVLRQTMPPEEVPEVPAMDGLWAEPVSQDDRAARRHLLERLRDAERELSEYRAVLHHHLDVATAELVARYREDPGESLSLLPRDSG